MFKDIYNWITAISTFCAFCVAWYQLNKIKRTESSRFLLELRESFSEEKRWKIHCAIKNNTTTDAIYLQENKADVDDYLGLLEICEEMLERKTLSLDSFKNFYHYRLKYILRNDFMIKKLLDDDISYWPKLYKLMNRFPDLKDTYYKTQEQILFWERIEDV
ncbi:MAG: hypothetical protein J6U56_02545 [Spirochaetia bacterium]|nr:hypothetical protein [Spirochaetia bacterium]